MIPGIKRITLLEIQEVLLGEKTLHITLKSEAIFEAIREHNRRLTPSGRLLSAKFRVALDDGGDVTVTICSRYRKSIRPSTSGKLRVGSAEQSFNFPLLTFNFQVVIRPYPAIIRPFM